MGWFMQEHDIYIGSMLDELNVRFAPTQKGQANHGGIQEMVELQKEFKFFKKGRSFRTSISGLNLSAWNNDVKNRWYNLVGALGKHESNKRGQDGDVAIVTALVKNLASASPQPVYFTSHDMRGDQENAQVKIFENSRPIHYLEQDYLTISLPMQPVSAAKLAKAKAAAPKAKPAAPKAKAAKK